MRARMRFAAVAGLVLFAASDRVSPARAQVPPASPRPPFRMPPGAVDVQDVYLPPTPADLHAISAGNHARQTVQTRGTLAFLEAGHPGYFQLRDGPARVVIIPMVEVAESLRSFVGRRVELIGYVRALERNQGTCHFRGQMNVPQSICEDPELPPKPDLDRAERLAWPDMSITVWSGSDATRPADKGAGDYERLADLLDSDGKRVITAVGRFCGANLCGGLTGPPPSPEAWVLEDGDTAIWVVGRRPKGNGFSLDPSYRGDTKRWLEVKGRLETCGATRCLRAQIVALKARPQSDE
jgi:hypothetical protein